VVNSTVVRRDIMRVEEEPFLHCLCVNRLLESQQYILHRLKLVTGVEISTRPVNTSGRPGKQSIKIRRTAAAAQYSATFRLSTVMAMEGKSNDKNKGYAMLWRLECRKTSKKLPELLFGSTATSQSIQALGVPTRR
jgi:hypothetical protein